MNPSDKCPYCGHEMVIEDDHGHKRCLDCLTRKDAQGFVTHGDEKKSTKEKTV